MPTLKAIHICNSHKPTLQPKIAKEYVFANIDKCIKKYEHTTMYKPNMPAAVSTQAYRAYTNC